jgi:hypothetical protein
MIKFYAIFILIPIISFAQTIDSVLSYYPLQTGNYWEYEYQHYHGFSHDTDYFSIEVIGDTIMPNNIQYKILERKSIPDTTLPYYFYERVDSIHLNTYRYFPGYLFPNDDALLDSLRANPGDHIYNSLRSYFTVIIPPGTLRCENHTVDSVLNILTTVKNFKELHFTSNYKYKIAKRLGLIYEYNMDMMFYMNIHLLFAVIDNVSYGIPLSIKDGGHNPIQFEVYQNYPNPFNSSTVIPFYLPKTMHIEITIFDLSGRDIHTIFDGRKRSGYHEIMFDGNQLSSGVYFYRMRSEDYTEMRKLILLK